MVGAAAMYYKLEWKALVIIGAMTAGFFFIGRSVIDLPLIIAPLMMGIIGGYTFKKEKSLEFFLLAASFSLAVLFSSLFYYMMFYENVDFMGMLRGEMVKFLDAARAPEDIRGQILADFDGSKDDLVARLPFSAFLNSLAMAGIGYAVIKRFLARLAGVRAGAGLESFRLNDYFIFTVIAGLAVYLLIDKSDHQMLHSAGLNALLIASSLYFVQALGVVKFLLIKRGVPRYILPLGIFTILIAGIWMALFMFIILAGLGALDVWADFRKMITAKIDKDQ